MPHTYRVESPDGARWLTITTHGDFERFVRGLSRVAERPELPAPEGLPTPEQAEALAEAARRHGIELVGPPLEVNDCAKRVRPAVRPSARADSPTAT